MESSGFEECARRAAVVLNDLPHMHVKAEETIGLPFWDQVSSFNGARDEFINPILREGTRIWAAMLW